MRSDEQPALFATIQNSTYLKLDAALSKCLQKIDIDLGPNNDFDAGEYGIDQISLAVVNLSSLNLFGWCEF